MSMPSKKRSRNVRHNDTIATETWSFLISRRAFTGLLKMSSSPIVLLGTTSCGSVLSGRWMKNRCTGQTIRSWTTILGPQEVKPGFGNHCSGQHWSIKLNFFFWINEECFIATAKRPKRAVEAVSLCSIGIYLAGLGLGPFWIPIAALKSLGH